MKIFRQPRKQILIAISHVLLFLIRPLVRREGPVIAKRGPVTVLNDHYYAPIPSAQDVEGGYFDRRVETPSLTIDPAAVLDSMAPKLTEPLARFRAWVDAEAERPGGFSLLNGGYMAVDAHMLFAMIVMRAPKRIVEIGAGASTAVIAAAAAELEESGGRLDHLCIEPYPRRALLDLAADPGAHFELMQDKVQHAPLSVFEELEPGDVLFIDSSHVLREGGDVQYEYTQILPRIAKGVIVHIHDIYLPRPYPKAFYDRGFYWNEQQLVQTMLAFSPSITVLWPTAYLMDALPDRMAALFPELTPERERYPDVRPSSFWIEMG